MRGVALKDWNTVNLHLKQDSTFISLASSTFLAGFHMRLQSRNDVYNFPKPRAKN